MKVVLMGLYPLSPAESGAPRLWAKKIVEQLSSFRSLDVHVVTIGRRNKESKMFPNIVLHEVAPIVSDKLIPIWAKSVESLMAKKAYRLEPDVIHVLQSSYPLLGVAKRVGKRFPTIVSILGLSVFDGKFINGIRKLINNCIYSPYEIKCLQGINAVTVESDSIGNHLRTLGYMGKIYPLPGGSDAANFQCSYGRRLQPSDVIFVGRLTFLKGVDVLLQALQILQRRNHRTYHLRIYGDGEARKPLEALSIRLGLGDSVYFEGYRPRDELIEAYKATKVVAIPSRWDCLPYSLIDAICLGKAIVVSNRANAEGAVNNGKNGLIFDSDNPEDLANKLDDVINNDSLRESFELFSLGISDKYSWKYVGKEVVGIYNVIINKTSMNGMI